MSSVSDRMRARVLASGRGAGVGAGVGDQTAPTLADLQRGQRARVVGYSIGVEPGAARRLFDLGLMPGIDVTMVRRAPLRDPVIFRVGDYEIALRRAQARVIHVDLQSDLPADLQADLAH
ncbi:MAG: FeoA family protein [Mycobacteriaceae bacterium]